MTKHYFNHPIFLFLLLITTLNSKGQSNKEKFIAEAFNGRIAIRYNSSKIFDTITVKFTDKSNLETKIQGGFFFIVHKYSNCTYNFLGLIDLKAKEWIVKISDTNENFLQSKIPPNPLFRGTSDDKNYLLITGGTGGNEFIQIYSINGLLMFSSYSIYVSPTEWINDHDLIFYQEAKVKNDTMPSFSSINNIWLQKLIWTPERIVYTDSIFQAYGQ